MNYQPELLAEPRKKMVVTESCLHLQCPNPSVLKQLTFDGVFGGDENQIGLCLCEAVGIQFGMIRQRACPI